VPRTRTPISLEVIPALVERGFRAIGKSIAPLQRVNLAALVAIETARGRSVVANNIGNISAAESYPGPIWRPPWFADPSHPTHAQMLAGRAPRAFRAYATPEDGARAFAALLSSPNYARLMRAANQPDAVVFLRALSERYSPDYGPQHAPTLRALQRDFGLGSLPGATGGGSDLATLLLLGLIAWAWWK